ncbi:MAG TPA: cbb3-type cytochrome c oxidase subunit 3 [Deltaproteobacteria bacterium]|nr:cbb3-type cytochrome c oxidase subunit 3 [Deltaproteobacteria bacterium]
MSQLLHGAESHLGWLMGWTTLLFFSSMIGWTWWAYAPSRRGLMERASQIPFEEEL